MNRITGRRAVTEWARQPAWSRRFRGFAVKCVFVCVALTSLLLPARSAHAYPWMIRHDYTACAQCHVDPSGGGPLSQYGRAMGEVLLRTRYGAETTAEGDEAEPGPGGKFLWGLLPLPPWLDLGGSWRVMTMTQRLGDVPVSNQIIWMQQDL